MNLRAKTKSGRTIQIVSDTKEGIEKFLKQFNAVLIEGGKAESVPTPTPAEKPANRMMETAEINKKGK